MKWRFNMNKSKLIADIKQNFMLKRIKAQEDAEAKINELRQSPEFNTIYLAYNQKKYEYLKSSYEAENLALKHEVEDLQAKINIYLKVNNIDKKSLEPKYDCSICNDTGVVGGQICKCLLSELNLKISKLCSSQTSFKSFEDCNTKIMNNDDVKAMNLLKMWCEKYPDTSKININIFGGAGCGKTFLMECVANEMIKQNYVVCYKTAFEINEQARLYHIGKAFDFSELLTAEVLFIDDLGTEPILKNVTKEYFYNLINTRQINKLPTIITSNLSLENLLARYDERIFSRLMNKNLSINILLNSQDKRVN